jgi:hypothetical protein
MQGELNGLVRVEPRRIGPVVIPPDAGGAVILHIHAEQISRTRRR